MSEQSLRELALGSQLFFKQPKSVVNRMRAGFFNASSATVTFILQVPGAGGATNWTTSVVTKGALAIYQYFAELNEETEETIQYWVPTAAGLIAFTVALYHYCEKNMSRFGENVIDQSIVRLLDKLNKELYQFNDQVETIDLVDIADTLVGIKPYTSVLSYKDKVVLLTAIEQLDNLLAQTDTPIAGVMAEFQQALVDFLIDNQLSELVANFDSSISLQN